MNDTTHFVIYCIEEYKSAEKLSGKAVIEQYRNTYLTTIFASRPFT
jgi:hypothetical protein